MKCGTILTIVAATLFVLALGVPAAQAAAITYTGTNGATNNDTWNIAGNWDIGIPSGATDVVIDTGNFAVARSAATPAYTGSLTLNDNATLKFWTNAADTNALGTGTITMNDGSWIIMRYGNYTYTQPITLLGDATIATGESTTGHHTTKNFNNAISGNYGFTIQGVNNNTINLKAVNTFSSFTADNAKGGNFRVYGKTAGSLGTGDVTINASSTLIIDAADAMADSGTLTLNGGRDTKLNASFSKLHMNFNDTVSELWIDGAQAFAGTYDNTAAWLSGSGTLTVTSGAGDLPPTLVGTDIVDDRSTRISRR